jgi:uncharacterized protein YdaU (DUF1376 family)
MKADIWMPLYIGDYLADTARLTTEQHGAYLLLIMDYWRSGKLPDNDQVLAQICKLSPDAWSNAKAMLKQYFDIDEGFWIHKRIESEIAEAKENKDKRHERALKGAKARWNNASSNATSTPQAMLIDCPLPSPSPSSIKRIKRVTPEGVLQNIWDDFLQLRKSKRSAVTDTVLRGIEKEAQKAGLSLNDALEHCCIAGWQSFNAEWYENSKIKSGNKIHEAPWQKAARLRMAEFAPGVAAQDPNDSSIVDMEFFTKPQEIKNVITNNRD